MKRLFLSSSFKDTAELLPAFAKEDLKGKTVTFIPTASIPEKIKFYVGSARKAFGKLGVIVDELEITQASAQEIDDKIRKNDYIYISGGNTFFLLQELKKTGADQLIVEQIESGKLYIGESAGSMIVAPDIAYVQNMDSVKAAPELETFSALNVIDFYPVPHHTNFPFAKAVEKIISKHEHILPLCPISNAQVICVNESSGGYHICTTNINQ